MRSLAVALGFAAFLGGPKLAADAQQANMAASENTVSEVSFQFARAGLSVPKYTIVLHEDGTGTYQAEVAPVSTGGASMGVSASARPVSQTIRISRPTTQMIFSAARAVDRFNIPCESKAKNIADTGKKILTYKGADGEGSCVYNYSENKTISQLTDTFQAIAQTMDEGRKLQFLHRFDRLGLYSEMDVLSHEVEEKRAVEVGNIAPALRSIVADEALMQKVRERAAHLLALEEGDAAPPTR
ncbi:MAG TPA: hypothetical protein VHN81_04140 [Edaphobacter sp.]|nr:hypothetical protein [Edaphobacter sp.]